MNTLSKRHHWWPVCHSALWVDEEGCITTINASGEIRRTQPRNTAVIGHYNTVRKLDGTPDVALENFFAEEIEGPVAPTLARLAYQTRRDFQLESRFDKSLLRKQRKEIKFDGFVPDERAFSATFSRNDRRVLARYIASLIVRVPSYKDQLNSEQMLQDISALLDVTSKRARFETDTFHVEILQRHLLDYATSLEECAYVLIDAADGEFVIGDTPIIPAALGFGEAEAMCPISPKRALLIIRGYRPPFTDRIPIFRSLKKGVKAFNKTMVQNAEREIFCRSTFPKAFVTKHIGTRKIRIVPSLKEEGATSIDEGPLLSRPPAPSGH